MELDFYLEQIDNYTIKVFDNTLSTQVDTIGDIYQMSLDVVCSKIPNEQVLGLDCLNHVLTYHRDKEIYEITSDVLGLGNSQILPDGMYTLTWTINNIISKEHKFCVYSTIESQINDLITSTGYNVQVGNYDITFTGDTCDGDVEQVRIAITLMDYLRQVAAEGNEVECNNTLDKLNRILLIINK